MFPWCPYCPASTRTFSWIINSFLNTICHLDPCVKKVPAIKTLQKLINTFIEEKQNVERMSDHLDTTHFPITCKFQCYLFSKITPKTRNKIITINIGRLWNLKIRVAGTMPNYYTSYSLSILSLAKILELILEISATYRLVICV